MRKFYEGKLKEMESPSFIIKNSNKDQLMMDLITSAKALGIEYEGLGLDELYSKVIEAKGRVQTGSINIENSSNVDQQMNDLIVSAKALGITYEGLSYDELYKKVVSAKKK